MVISENYYTNLTEYADEVASRFYEKDYRKKKPQGYYVYRVAASFDIETTSFYSDGEKSCLMYIWQFGIDGVVCIGRTWDDFIRLLKLIQNRLNLSDGLRLFVYVHNLSYEFQFMRKWVKWHEVFSVDVRKPITALCEYGVEFRDSYILSGYSLEMTGKQLHKYKVEKKVGFLDYSKIRTKDTKLTNDEILYCINDVLVVMAYIQERIEEYGKITKIPLTNTGIVRSYCREKCFYGFSENKQVRLQTKYDYDGLMNRLTLTKEEYILWKMAYQGGFTHANSFHVEEECKEVASYDFTSSYPYVMLSEKYPMGKGVKVEKLDRAKYEKLNDSMIMVFVLKLVEVSPKILYENPLSFSKCFDVKEYILNNGRVVFAKELTTVCTNIDYEIYRKFYNFESAYISNCYCYAKGYLPKNLILSIASLYKKKTELKGVEGKEKEYLHSKGMLNSVYGMCVTDIVRDENIYTDGWNVKKADMEKEIAKYNENRSRFLFYPWGCMVTAYARRNLFSGIVNCGMDYIYSDTDSIKVMDYVSHETYFKEYNDTAIKKLNDCFSFYGIPERIYKPKTVKGIEKPLGVWDFEGVYDKFKTLGAKRYIYTEKGKLHCTVAGVSKTGIARYFIDKHGNDFDGIFKEFSNGLTIPSDYTGKNTHTYIDDEMEGVLTDFQGHTSAYLEKSGIHLSETEFNLSMSAQFLDYLRGVKYESQI